ncbi:MAG: GAF domain-containing protein [Coleofasciculaceae cyanobacterium SM2_3_26]|nr:GAF domain-containing protein [Coleofasciculaceae cyanobacterium SM2_3_26]
MEEGRLADTGFIHRSTKFKQVFASETFDITNDSQQALDTLEPLLLQTIWQTQDLEVVLNVQESDRIGRSPQMAAAYRTLEIRSSLIVPLVSQQYEHPTQQTLLAVLALHQCWSSREWQDDEIQLLYMVADQAALTLSQARAYETVRSLAQREALINSITTAIRSSLEPRKCCRYHPGTRQALNADGCALSLWTEDKDFVQCAGLYDREATDGQEGIETEPRRAVRTHVPVPLSLVPIEGNPVLQELLRTHQPAIVEDMSETEAHDFWMCPFG